MHGDPYRKCLVDQLMLLAESYKLDEITVLQLCESSCVSRQAFYNRFYDINDIICYAASRPLEGRYMPYLDEALMEAILEKCLHHKAFFTQLGHQNGQNNYWDELVAWGEQLCRCNLLAGLPQQVCLAFEVWSTGCVGMVRHWCAKGMPNSAREVAQALRDALPTSVTLDKSCSSLVGPGYPGRPDVRYA